MVSVEDGAKEYIVIGEMEPPRAAGEREEPIPARLAPTRLVSAGLAADRELVLVVNGQFILDILHTHDKSTQQIYSFSKTIIFCPFVKSIFPFNPVHLDIFETHKHVLNYTKPSETIRRLIVTVLQIGN